jgi:hypothetical protein
MAYLIADSTSIWVVTSSAEEHARASSFCTAAQILSLAGKASIATALPLRMPFASVVPFYCEHGTYDMRSRQNVIALDARGDVTGLTISQHMADIFDLDQTMLDANYPAFCRFGRMAQEDRYMMHFLMKAGECMVFDNHQIVHGRSAYSADSGSRYLRGCYTDRGEMRSTYLARVNQGRFAAAASGPSTPDASAWCIHGTIHHRLPEARVVLHCHSPYATALACLKDPAIVPIDNNTARFTGARPLIWPWAGSRHGGAAFRVLKGAAASADIAVSAAGGPMVTTAVQ